MELNVKVTVDLGEATRSLICGHFSQMLSPQNLLVVPEPKETEPETPAIEKQLDTTPEKPSRTRRTKEQINAEKTETINGWDDMNDEDRLNAIKEEVTKHTKKGKSMDIKKLLAHFDAGRASELSSDDYTDFFTAIRRYGDGESIDDIINLD